MPQIEIERDYIVGGRETPNRHYSTRTFYVDEEDAEDYLYATSKSDVTEEEINEMLEDFDYNDPDFIEWCEENL